MVRADGYVKVLDFGLAKLIAAPTNRAARTTRRRADEPGVVIGTVALHVAGAGAR